MDSENIKKATESNRKTSRSNSWNSPWKRREFILALSQAIGTSTLLMAPSAGIAESLQPKPALTVGQVMDIILKEIPRAPFKDTVDTLKSGTPDQTVTGIVSTSFATLEIIEKAVKLGANFIIVHEPTYYNHRDETDWLEQDAVYQHKRDLLKKHNIAVWRFHDYWHSHRPDGIQMGVLTTLGWEKQTDKDNLHVITLPPTPLKQVVEHVKAKLGIQMVRVMGNPAQLCQRIALLPGAPGGRSQIKAIQEIKPDICICGELSEWETSEYIRDAEYMGQKRALILLGHALSEEPGMEWLVSWLQPKVPGIKITYISAGNPFSFM
jgi:putative NIF3 family GTP cyclohydrolase 1 type 2